MRIFLLGNSQATGVGVPPGRSYPALVRHELVPEHEVHLLAMNGWSVRDFDFHYENVTLLEPDLVVLQAGIVECSRRILSELEKRLLYRVPGSQSFTKFLHDRRQRVIRFRNRARIDTRLFTTAEFDLIVTRLVEKTRASGAELLLLEIPRFGPSYEARHFPLLKDDIELFNGVLRQHGAVPFFDQGDECEEIWQPGTVHFDEAGHRLAAERVAAQIRDRAPLVTR